MPDGSWLLEDFLERLDQWAERESVPVDLRFVVTEWILSRMDDPYEGVRRDTSIPNLWYGKVPGPYDVRDRSAVVCSYFINERDHSVRCDSFARLGLPI